MNDGFLYLKEPRCHEFGTLMVDIGFSMGSMHEAFVLSPELFDVIDSLYWLGSVSHWIILMLVKCSPLSGISF